MALAQQVLRGEQAVLAAGAEIAERCEVGRQRLAGALDAGRVERLAEQRRLGGPRPPGDRRHAAVGDARAAHSGDRKPVASGADLLEFEVVIDAKPKA